MTRETKVGMIVAGSFITLVGIVIMSKMQGGDPGSDQVASTVKPGGEEESQEKKGSAKIDAKDFPAPKSAVTPAHATEPAPTPEPPLPLPPPVKDSGFPVISKEEQDKILADLKIAKGPSPMPDLPGFPKDGLPPPPIVDPLKEPPPVAPPPVAPPPAVAEKKDEKITLPLPEPPPPVAPPVVGKETPPPPPVVGKEMPPPVALPEPPKIVSKDPPPPAVFPMVGTPEPTPPPVFPTPKKDPLPPPVAFEKKDGLPPPVGIGPPPIVDRKDDLPPLGSDFKKPPVGIAPPTTTPTLPKVTSVDIMPVVLRPEDVTFDALSQRLYGSDRYAQALLAFNRIHPSATDDVRATPPRLVSGRMIYMPPKSLLESKYASLIPEARPVIGLPGPETTPVKIAAPAPTPPLGSPKTTPVSLGSPTIGVPAPRPDVTKRYVVAAPGKHLLQIAQETLGDRNRWPEIYRLNPAVPTNLIPGGTELRLPMDARVP